MVILASEVKDTLAAAKHAWLATAKRDDAVTRARLHCPTGSIAFGAYGPAPFFLKSSNNDLS
jgi:hypothetical protein